MRSAWPTEAALKTALYAAGLIDSATPTGAQAAADYGGALDAAVEWFGDQTRCQPFQAEAAPGVTRYFDPDNSKILNLRTGWVTVTAVRTQYSTSYAGNLLTENVDYWLRGPNPGVAPYTYIEFRDVQTGDPGSISVLGQRGFAASIPQVAYDAVLAYAMARLAPGLLRLKTGGLLERQSGDEREKFEAVSGGEASGGTAAAFMEQAKAGVRACKLATVGIA